MTSVLPFFPAILAGTIAPTATASADAVDPANSFAALLDDPAISPQKLQPHLFAFTELGMFGRHGAQSLAAIALNDEAASVERHKPIVDAQSVDEQDAPPAQIASVRDESSVVDPQVPIARAPQLKAQKTVALLRQIANAVPTNVQPPTLPQMPRTTQQIVTPLLSETGTESEEQSLPVAEQRGVVTSQRATPLVFMESLAAATPFEVDAELSVNGNGKSARSDLPTQPNPSPSLVNLLVSGSNDALAVSVRAAAESTEDFVRLRRLVEEIVAEFGMDVAEFRLNGSATEQSFRAIAGGNHGSRTR